MAKFEDYKHLNGADDELNKEIDDAAKNQETRQDAPEDSDTFVLPKQFEGKSVEDVAKSFVELQKLNSRQAQDLGRMRQTVDQFIELSAQKGGDSGTESSDTAETPPVDYDTLIDDPEKAISQVVDKAVGRRVAELEKTISEKDTELALAKFEEEHSDWQDIIADQAFVDWVGKSRHRISLAQKNRSVRSRRCNGTFWFVQRPPISQQQERR